MVIKNASLERKNRERIKAYSLESIKMVELVHLSRQEKKREKLWKLNLVKKKLRLKTFIRKDIFTTDVNKVVISDKVSCNNGKDCHYIVGYQVNETLIPLSIKTP